MSTSNPAKMHLKVKCEDSATEIFIIDGRFNLCDRGIGYTETELEPGIYKVKVRAGFETYEQHVIVSDHDESLTIPPFSFVSPAPLAGTAKTHEFHMGAAEVGSKNPDLVKGHGSSIFIFSRDWTSQTQSSAAPPNIPNPGLGLSLREMNGDVIADLTTAGKRSDSWEPWVSFNVELEPGCYRLNLRLPKGGSIEQTLVACSGWQTQVFLLQSYYDGTDADTKRADLQGASIQLAPLDMGFKSDNPLWRLSELARLGLANERKVLSKDLREMLVGKFENPMLGLYGAHLLLLEAEPDMKLLNEVVDNLHKLLPSGHPDLDALDLFLKRVAPAKFEVPPMLRKSWTHIVNATAENPQIVPPDSLAAEAALHQWGSGTWLLWQHEEAQASTQRGLETIGKVAVMLSNAEVMLRSRLRTATLEGQFEKTDSPFAAISKLRAKRKKRALPAAVRDLMPPQTLKGADPQRRPLAQLNEQDVNHLVQSLCIPRANLERIIKKLETDTEEETEES